MTTILEQAKNSIQRIQEFDSATLPREADLGRQLSFRDAVAPAQRIVKLYKQLSLETLSDFGDHQLNQLYSQADADFHRFNEVLNFDITPENATGRRDHLISQIEGTYQQTFDVMYPLIAYGMTRAVDFQTMENEARAMIQSVQDQASDITESLEGKQKQAEQVLDDIRKVAAEQGVSQQSIYFKEESERHERLASEWRDRTKKVACLLGFYSFVAIFLHKIPGLTPTDVYQSAQLITGKMLVFAVIGYILILFARNFLSHEHNAIVNKHRQNALMTFRALVNAAKEEDCSDIVLLHAAQCIFSPQETGYAKQDGSKGGFPFSPIEILRKSTSKNV